MVTPSSTVTMTTAPVATIAPSHLNRRKLANGGHDPQNPHRFAGGAGFALLGATVAPPSAI